MKKQLRIVKLAVCLLLAAVLGLSMVSCGTGTVSANDASGSHGSLSWSYTKDNKTLTVYGSGDMADFESADAVVWANVRAGVEKLVVGEGITSVGSYAFYHMPALKEVILPSTLTVIGKYGFAYAGALETVALPEGLQTVGAGAFEGCGSMKSIYLPATVTSVGDNAFAYCYTMQTALLTAESVSVGAKAFKNCRALTTLMFHTGMSADKIAADAFEGASKTFSEATLTDNATGATTVTVTYQYADGTTAAEPVTQTHAYGEEYAVNSPTLEGYTADKLTVSGTADGTAHNVTVTYTKVEEVTEAPVEEPVPDEDDKITPTTIIAIVVMAVVLIGIAVGAFLLIRSDKKTAGKNTTTVRKSPEEKAKKYNKKGR